ncbi:unnamed protein product, partial [Ixodes hexagonus]
LEDGTSILHRPVRIKTRERGPTALATAAVVVAALLVAITVIAAIFWRRISVYIEEYKNTTVKVLIPAEFGKEPIKKSDSVRSNLREYVLSNKDSPYGIPHILRSPKLQEPAEEAQCPEADRLLGDTSPGIPTLPDITLLTSDKYFDEATRQAPLVNTPSQGYSMVSMSQGKNAEPIDHAYSKFSSLQDCETTQKSPVVRGYSLFSSFALNKPDANSAAKEPLAMEGTPGYSKFAPFLREVDLGSTETWNLRWNGPPDGKDERFSGPNEMPQSCVKVASEVPSQSTGQQGSPSRPTESSQLYVKVGSEALPLSKYHKVQSPETQRELDKHQPYVKVGYEMPPYTKNGSDGTKKGGHQLPSSELEGMSDPYVKVGYEVQPTAPSGSSDSGKSAAENMLPVLPQGESGACIRTGYDMQPAQPQNLCDGGIKPEQDTSPPVRQGLSNSYVKIGYEVAPSNDSRSSFREEKFSQACKAAPYCQLATASTLDTPLVYSKVAMRAQEHNQLTASSAETIKDVSDFQERPFHVILSDDECQHDSPGDNVISEKGSLNPSLDFSALGCPNFLSTEFQDHGIDQSKDGRGYHTSEGYTTWAALAKPSKHQEGFCAPIVDVRQM